MLSLRVPALCPVIHQRTVRVVSQAEESTVVPTEIVTVLQPYRMQMTSLQHCPPPAMRWCTVSPTESYLAISTHSITPTLKQIAWAFNCIVNPVLSICVTTPFHLQEVVVISNDSIVQSTFHGWQRSLFQKAIPGDGSVIHQVMSMQLWKFEEA